MTSRWITLLFFLAAPIACAQQPLTVCEMLDSANEGQEVIVRGILSGEPHHGYGLVMEGNRDGSPCTAWRRRFLTSPAAVGIGFFSELGVTLTEQQKQRNGELLYRIRKERFTSRRVIFQGVFVKRPLWYRIIRHLDGHYECLGAGWDGECTGYFVVRTILAESY